MGEKLFGVTPFGWRFSSARGRHAHRHDGGDPGAAVVRQRVVDVRRRAPHGGREPQRGAVTIGAARHPPGVLGARRVPAPVAGPAMDRPTNAARTGSRARGTDVDGERSATGRRRPRRSGGRVPPLASVAVRGRHRARLRVLGQVVGRHGDLRRADPVVRMGDDAPAPSRRLARTGVRARGSSGEPRPVHRVRAAAGGRLLHRVPAVVQPLRVEPEGLVGEPDRDARVPQEPADDRARHRDEHVHADAPVLLARMDVAVHVAAGELLLARRRARTSRRSWPSGTPRSSGRASGRSRSSP